MAIQNVTIFTCDGCKTTEQRNLKKDCDGGLSEVVLPPYWLEVNTRAYPRVGGLGGGLDEQTAAQMS